MRILITGHALNYLSGHSMYCYELARQFLRTDHEVAVASSWKPSLGDGWRIGAYLEAAGAQCLTITDTSGFDAEIIIASQVSSLPAIVDHPLTPVINVIHSEYEQWESPIRHQNVRAWVGIRESIQQKLSSVYELPPGDCYVIYNGIDTERFHPGIRNPVQRDYEVTLIPATLDPLRAKFFQHMVEQADEHHRIRFVGLEFEADFDRTSPYIEFWPDTFHIEKEMADADWVAGILLGRVNLEAAAMGIPSYVYDPETLEREVFHEFDERYDIRTVSQHMLRLVHSIVRVGA